MYEEEKNNVPFLVGYGNYVYYDGFCSDGYDGCCFSDETHCLSEV